MARQLSASERFSILERDGFRCCYCGAGPEVAHLHVDHIVPRSRGGSNDPSNLAAACEDCNLGKSARLLLRPLNQQFERAFATTLYEWAHENLTGSGAPDFLRFLWWAREAQHLDTLRGAIVSSATWSEAKAGADAYCGWPDEAEWAALDEAYPQ